MEKQKRWQLFLITGVIFLTAFNILPTVFYYVKPLKLPVTEKQSQQIATSIVHRITDLENQSIEWVESFCKLLRIQPSNIALDPKQPEFIQIGFTTKQDADIFKHYIPRAGSLIPFIPAQLTPYEPHFQDDKQATVRRRIPVHIDLTQTKEYFQYSKKFEENGQVTPLYQALVHDRILELTLALGGSGENAQALQSLIKSKDPALNLELALQLSENLQSFVKAFGSNTDAARRFFASFSQTEEGSKQELIQKFIAKLESVKDTISTEKKGLSTHALPESPEMQQMQTLTYREQSLEATIGLIKTNQLALASGKPPWTYASVGASMQSSLKNTGNVSAVQTFDLDGKNPFFEKMAIDWQNGKILITPYVDVTDRIAQFHAKKSMGNDAEQIIYNQIAYVNRQSGENITPFEKSFTLALSKLPASNSFLAFRLGQIAAAQSKAVQQALVSTWNPTHPDLKSDAFPIWDYETYETLSLEDKKLGLVIYYPVGQQKSPEHGFRMNSIYVIAKGFDRILKKHEQSPDSESTRLFLQNFHQLRQTLQKCGFIGFSGSTLPLNKNFSDDYIFEAPDYFLSVLTASRENFEVHGTKRYALLEFSDLEQRILTENKIDNAIHEDLLKWRDDYRAAQINLKGASFFDVPKPTKNPLWSNLTLSAAKYFRGDDRKVLHWGLDLSGGKTVQIQLTDSNNKIVTNELDIKQGINELYQRVNKMGLSEVAIRQEGNYITLDFPGSQGLSASELVRASSMYFNVVNEKFSPKNGLLAESVSRFLQDVWNEAVVTGKNNPDDLNALAWKHLFGEAVDQLVAQPRTESAKLLFDNGLRLANPADPMISNTLDQVYSKIAVFRGDDYTQWNGQTHPLLLVFNNFALEGSSLENVHASYDPSKGNFLSFGVKTTASSNTGEKIHPRNDLSAWTTPFSKEHLAGTSNEIYSQGNGWRMAVILNGTIVSAPTLDSALQDSAMISGSFSQREINQLEADLKAGSLTFTPKILSEKNVSPDLGAQERHLGILATVIALILVISMMIGYYRFGGVIASIAVVFNLLIMWATLQNIQAILTLPMIAGLILTVGMAVDANVLVFERIREEFSISGRLASAIQAGYQKAFSAILDSNVTTVIAGMILLHFDSGPIKGFALTLIIGILSSMFTALFMTKFFFARWVQNPNNKKLHMLNWFKKQNFDFLKHKMSALILSSIIIVIGLLLFTSQKSTLIGMDFTGGYALNLEIKPTAATEYRTSIEQALMNKGLTNQDFQIRELSPPNNIKLFLSRAINQKGKPFYNMHSGQDTTTSYYPGNNPRIDWIVSTLNENHLPLTAPSLMELDANWSELSGQMSDTMRNNAVIGLLIALLSILVYITIRFEFMYAISAILCLAHDIALTIGALVILHACRVPVQIDLNIIAALMTIVGYSLNDTIIIFDRIREDLGSMKKGSFKDIINHSLNVTLSRTIMTSGTTLLVLLPLILLGGTTILGFSLVMAMGVIFGTLSSLFIATPLLLFFHNRKSSNKRNRIANVS